MQRRRDTEEGQQETEEEEKEKESQEEKDLTRRKRGTKNKEKDEEEKEEDMDLRFRICYMLLFQQRVLCFCSLFILLFCLNLIVGLSCCRLFCAVAFLFSLMCFLSFVSVSDKLLVLFHYHGPAHM